MPINLLIDATFFGRDYGYLCFHDTKRVIYFKEIKTETVRDLKELAKTICQVKYQQKFIDNFYQLKNQYQHFLHQRNDQGEYKQYQHQSGI